MTDLLSRPRPAPAGRRSPGPDGQPAWFPLLPTAAVGVATAGLIGLVLCVGLAVLGWVAAPAADVVAAARVGTWVWLLANGSLLHLGPAGPGTVDSLARAAPAFTGPIAIAPLGLSLLLVLVLARTTAAGVRAAVPDVGGRREGRPLLVLALVSVALHVGLALVVARWLADGSTLVRVDLPRTAAGAAVLAGLGVGFGVVSGCGGWRRVLRAAPRPVAVLVRGSAAGLGLLVGAAGVLLAASVLEHHARVVALSRAIGGGAVGQSLLTLAQVALLPQGLADAVAWLAGPGFTVGTATVVAPTGVVLGPLPAVPLLGALPDPGSQPLWAGVVVFVPALAGLLAGLVAARGLRRGPVASAGTALLAGLAVGVLATGLLAASQAHLGSGRLAHVGPLLAPAAVLLLLSCSAGGLLGAAVAAVPAGVRALCPTRAPLPGPIAPVGPPSVPPAPIPRQPVQPPQPVQLPQPVVTEPASVAPDPMLRGLQELLLADLRLLLRARSGTRAGDVAAELGREAHVDDADDQHDQQAEGPEHRRDGGGAGPDVLAVGLAQRPDARDDGTAGSDDGEHPGEPREFGGAVERGDGEEAEHQAEQRDAKGPAAGEAG